MTLVKKFLVALSIGLILSSTGYAESKKSPATIIDVEDFSHQFENIAFFKKADDWVRLEEFSGYYGKAYLNVPFEKIDKIIITHVRDKNKKPSVRYYGTVYLKNGISRELRLVRGRFEFRGESDFGREVISQWDIKEIHFSKTLPEAAKNSEASTQLPEQSKTLLEVSKK